MGFLSDCTISLSLLTFTFSWKTYAGPRVKGVDHRTNESNMASGRATAQDI